MKIRDEYYGRKKQISYMQQWRDIEISKIKGKNKGIAVSTEFTEEQKKIRVTVIISDTFPVEYVVSFYRTPSDIICYTQRIYGTRTGTQLPDKYSEQRDLLRHASRSIIMNMMKEQ